MTFTALIIFVVITLLLLLGGLIAHRRDHRTKIKHLRRDIEEWQRGRRP